MNDLDVRKQIALGRPKPKADRYHRNNLESQGALLCETTNFPEKYQEPDEKYIAKHSEEIAEDDYCRLAQACAVVGAGENEWATRLPELSDEELKEFARVSLGISVEPSHARIVYFFNVMTGNSCPKIEAIFPA